VTSTPTVPVTLDVWADIACPWCFIGHRQLDAVVRPDAGDVHVVHRAFQLQPEMPPRGRPYAEFLTETFGAADVVHQIFDRVIAVGHDVGIAFNFSDMPVAPNSELAHRALALVTDLMAQRRAVEALFSAFFENALDITDQAVVVRTVSHAAGLDPLELVAALNRGEGADSVERDQQESRELGISAVPTFVADMRFAVQGAQPPEVLRGVIDQARAFV